MNEQTNPSDTTVDKQAKQHNNGASSLLSEEKRVEWQNDEGVTQYAKVRRLAVRDITTLARLLADPFKRISDDLLEQGVDLEKIKDMGLAGLTSFIVMELPRSGPEYMDFMADLIGLSSEDFGNLPPIVIPQIVAHLEASQDLADFFTYFKVALGASRIKDWMSTMTKKTKKQKSAT